MKKNDSAGTSGKNVVARPSARSWVNPLITFVVFSGLAVGWYFWPASSLSERSETPIVHGSLPAPTPVTESSSTTPLRPTWMRPQGRPTSVARRRFESILRGTASSPQPYFGDSCVTDPRCRRVIEARDRILAREGVPAEVWAWPELRAALREVGTGIGLVRAYTPRPDCSMFFSLATNELVVCTENVERFPVSAAHDLEALLELVPSLRPQ